MTMNGEEREIIMEMESQSTGLKNSICYSFQGPINGRIYYFYRTHVVGCLEQIEPWTEDVIMALKKNKNKIEGRVKCTLCCSVYTQGNRILAIID